MALHDLPDNNNLPGLEVPVQRKPSPEKPTFQAEVGFIATFGLFVKVADGREYLVHKSRMPEGKKAEDFTEGESVKIAFVGPDCFIME